MRLSLHPPAAVVSDPGTGNQSVAPSRTSWRRATSSDHHPDSGDAISADRRGHCLPGTRQLRNADQVDLALLGALRTCVSTAAEISCRRQRADAAAGLSRHVAGPGVKCPQPGLWLRPARRACARARTSPVSAGLGAEPRSAEELVGLARFGARAARRSVMRDGVLPATCQIGQVCSRYPMSQNIHS